MWQFNQTGLPSLYMRKWSNRITAGTKLLATLFLLLLFQSSKLWAQDPGRGGTQAGFEVDADFKSGFIPSWWIGSGSNQNYFPNTSTFGFDWSGPNAVLMQVNGVSVPGYSADGRAVWHIDGNWGTASPVPEGFSFAGNSNKNGDNIAAGKSPYSLQKGGSGPQKNDITNTYLYSKQVMVGNVPHTWLFFGAETRATNGNSYIDFEYNQAGVTVSPSLDNPTQLIGNGLVNGRTVGDFLLVVNYTGGGNRPIIGVRTWLTSGTWSAELPVTASQFITTNSAAVDPVAPNKAYASDGSYANTVMALQFMEGGVDITDLNIAALNLCTPNATVTIKTRSSSSYTAELKDLDVINFSILPPAGLTDLSPVSVCPGADKTVSFTTTVSGDGANGANVEWYFGTTKLSNGTKYAISSTSTTSTLMINGIVSADDGFYKAVLTKASCGSPEKSARLTVNPVPTADAGTPPDAQCYSSSGNTFNLNGSGQNGTASWAVAPNGNPNNFPVQITNGNTFTPSVRVTTGTRGGTVTLRLTVSSNQTPACGSATSDVSVTVSAQVPGPNVDMLPITCISKTFSIKITNPASGITYSLTQPLNGNTKTFTPITYNGTDPVIFTGLTFGDGYSVIASQGGCASAPTQCISDGAPVSNLQKVQSQEITLNAAKSQVVAAPNPFSDRIRFSIKSAISGQGSLELYNMLGQKVKTVFQGYVSANQVQSIEYAVPGSQRANLIYVFRVGNEQTSGKLIGLK